jgi:hypothetical protein
VSQLTRFFRWGLHIREQHIMNRRAFLMSGAASLLVASTAVAPGARLPVSTVTVEILSVDPQSVQRDDYRRETVKDGAVSSTWSEKTAVITRARVKAVVVDDGHGLSPDAIIDLHYEVVRGPVGSAYGARAPEVKPGEIWTVGVVGGVGSYKGTSFEPRGWTKSDAPAKANLGARP